MTIVIIIIIIIIIISTQLTELPSPQIQLEVWRDISSAPNLKLVKFGDYRIYSSKDMKVRQLAQTDVTA